MHRRSFLAGAGVVLPTSLSGCSNGLETDNSGDSPTLSPTSTQTHTRTEKPGRRGRHSCGAIPEDGPERGTDGELEVHGVATDPRVEYRPDTESVRYPHRGYHPARSIRIVDGNEEERTPTPTPTPAEAHNIMPAEKWGRRRCRVVAALGVIQEIRTTLESENIDATTTSDRSTDDRVLTVTTYMSPDEECDFEWDVRFEELIAVTPRNVVATYELDEFEYRVEYPGFAQRRVRGAEPGDRAHHLRSSKLE